MKFTPWTLEHPAANLAAEEALLDACETSGEEVLRVWESPSEFVVVGYGNRVATEVDVEACAGRDVPVFRRCSGGGTVVQGPGCLSYALVLQAPEHSPLGTVTAANKIIMERNRAAMARLMDAEVAVQGCTDLTMRVNSAWLKFSGNSQRRRRRALLFHGTILYNFDLALITGLLRKPSSEPDYRANRSHELFVTNAPITRDAATDSLREAWQADIELQQLPCEAAQELVRSRYAREEWNRMR